MRSRKKTPTSEASDKTGKQMDEESWRAPLEAISINDDEWWCIVCMMVETITEHSRCVSLFNAAADQGKRKAIYSLSCQKTLASVRALSKQSLDKCPIIQGVCHYASKALNEDNDKLPGWLMARVIKYLIYRAREESIGVVKRLADLEREIDEEYWIMQTVTDWGQPRSKTFDAERFNRKANTKLRKRGEDWRDTVYVDDAPLDGPNIYVILTGFRDPDLPALLINAGVPLKCMLQIKRPNENLVNRPTGYETIDEEPSLKKFQFLEKYNANRAELFNFWTNLKKLLMNPEKYPEYCDIGFVVFCPPQLADASNDEEYEDQKKDIYNRVSYILYDFYDLYRQHCNYLKSMKIEKNIVDESTKKVSTEVYETILNAFPLECLSVPLILFAILTQVEENEKRIAVESSIDERGDARINQETDEDTKTEVKTTSQRPVSSINQKIHSLNVKFDLDDEEPSTGNSRQNVPDIELILHGDNLFEAIHLLDDSAIVRIAQPTALMDNVLSIFNHPIITTLHEKHGITEKKLNEYSRHIRNVRQFLNGKISIEEIRHYLHILVFDKMIFKPKKCKRGTTKIPIEEEIKNAASTFQSIHSMKRCKSLPSLGSKSTQGVHFLSDGNIDYGKTYPEITECSHLFDLVDPRELLVPGYLKGNVFDRRTTDIPRIEDFNDVELLSGRIFLQHLHQCLLAFDHLERRYFEPTDSLLVYFGNKWRINGVSEEERVSRIRTPVRFRDFCEYVVPEEEDWLRREEERYRLQTAESMGRLMKRSAEIYDETILFRDEDFILPGTLKAKDLERSRELDRQKSGSGPDIPSDFSTEEAVKSSKEAKKKRGESSKKKKKGSDKSTSRKTASKKSIEKEDSLSFTRETSQVLDDQKEAVYDFIGYDLGSLRVQVTNSKNTFCSADGTMVQVEMDDWLYKTKNLRIAISLRGYTLRLCHEIGRPDASRVFHLTSKSGIILAFQKQLTPSCALNNPFRDWQNMNVEFRISWPIGLIVESITGDGPENPYYIQQSYIPKGYSICEDNRETCRKFLRNGTVLKYLDDGRVIVFRPNGVIVTCTDFEKLQVKQHENLDQTNISSSAHTNGSGDKSKDSKISRKSRKRPMNSLKSQLLGAVDGESAPAQQNSTTNHDDTLAMVDSAVKVSRYTVLNHDGGRYEVFNDSIVSEQHRLLVRMASDYEVDEKFTRRADGTNMLLNSNGELIVRFPDGTRITTGYTIEKEPATCDWTEEEIQRYFASNETGEDEECVDPLFSSLTRVCEDSSFSKRDAGYEERLAELSIVSSFVSVLLTCRVEHKNYATVSYDQSAVSCSLSMPDDLRVSISGRGHYEVSMADGVNMKIDEDILSLKGNSCTTCGNQSTTIYNFLPFDSTAAMLTTTDVFGNVFQVKGDGTTHYHPNDKNANTVHSNEREEYCAEECEEGFTTRASCNHQRLYFKPKSLDYRIFSINRDLTAYEYIHRVKKNHAELMAMFDKSTSAILYPNPDRTKLHRLIICEPVGTRSKLRDALSIPDFQLKPTNVDRKCILRSTYSIPYDWLFPFGRNGDGIWKNTHDLPLMTDVWTPPELLRIRILCGFKEPSENAVIDLQRALGQYWISLVQGSFPSYVTKDQEEKVVEAKKKIVFERLDDNLCALALGIKKTIDVETYKIGLERRSTPLRVKTWRTSIKFDEFLVHSAMEKEELEWYKRTMREKFVLPYFRNIAGTCFLWVMDCMENALNVSADESFDEASESQNFRFLRPR
ncbi:unnamed protein product [Xylocopa violacea]|uniref:Sperm-associated antigen 17 n=1 Tax=Xylocopa violacea TaxID=135666 RepID=A0ABP1NVJ0_XYLVO